MESKAHYALIGTLVIIFLISVLAGILWLSGNNLDQEFDEYVVTFEGPIRGVQEAAEVRFNGIKVGEVSQIRLDPNDPNKVLVRLQVFEETPVDTQSFAQLEPQGLTGLNIIQLSSGGGNYPLLKEVEGARPPYGIDGRHSQIDNLLTGGGSIVESAQMALTSLLDAADEEAIADFHTILDNVAAITAEYRADPLTASRLKKTLDKIDQASLDVSASAISINQTSEGYKALLQSDVLPILSRTKELMESVDVTLADVRTVLGSTDSTVNTAEGTILAFQNGTLRDLEIASANLNELIYSLDRLADQLERNPSSVLVGEKRDLLELPQ